MTARPIIPSILLAMLAPLAAAPAVAGDQSSGPVQLAQLSIRERVVVRVRRIPATPPNLPAPAAVRWKEKGGPRCVAVSDLAGALVTQPDAVDLVMAGGQRLRAKLDGECRPLDFYSGLYLKQASDGLVCSDRDTIRARSGATCPIKRFRKLVPEKPRH